MRLAVTGAAMAVVLSLGACQVPPLPGPGVPVDPGAPPPNNVSQIISQVQQAAITACAFQPTVQTVSSIIGAFTSVGAQIASVNQLASQICAAISVPKSQKRAAGVPQYCIQETGKCVPIRGKWVGRH